MKEAAKFVGLFAGIVSIGVTIAMAELYSGLPSWVFVWLKIAIIAGVVVLLLFSVPGWRRQSRRMGGNRAFIESINTVLRTDHPDIWDEARSMQIGPGYRLVGERLGIDMPEGVTLAEFREALEGMRS